MIKVSELPRRNGYEQIRDLAYFDKELKERAGTRLIPILQFEVSRNSGITYGTHKYIYKLIDENTNEIIKIYDEKVDKYFEPSEFKIPEDRTYTAFRNPIGETKFDLRGVSLATYYEVCQCINRPQKFYDVSIIPINFYITQAIAFGDEYRFEGIRDWFKTTIKYEMEPDALRIELENLFNQCLPAFNKDDAPVLQDGIIVNCDAVKNEVMYVTQTGQFYQGRILKFAEGCEVMKEIDYICTMDLNILISWVRTRRNS